MDLFRSWLSQTKINQFLLSRETQTKWHSGLEFVFTIRSSVVAAAPQLQAHNFAAHVYDMVLAAVTLTLLIMSTLSPGVHPVGACDERPLDSLL